MLAHEISHVGNRDILIGSVAAATATAITYLFANLFRTHPHRGTGQPAAGRGVGRLTDWLRPATAGSRTLHVVAMA